MYRGSEKFVCTSVNTECQLVLPCNTESTTLPEVVDNMHVICTRQLAQTHISSLDREVDSPSRNLYPLRTSLWVACYRAPLIHSKTRSVMATA